MIVRVLTACHTQYTWDRSRCIFLFNRTTVQVFVTYLTGTLYVHPLWFCRRQHDNRVRSELFAACQRWWFQWRFWFVPSVPGSLWEEEEHKPDPWRNPIERNKKIHILLSQVCCVWQVVETPTVILNNPVLCSVPTKAVCSSFYESSWQQEHTSVPSWQLFWEKHLESVFLSVFRIFMHFGIIWVKLATSINDSLSDKSLTFCSYEVFSDVTSCWDLPHESFSITLRPSNVHLSYLDHTAISVCGIFWRIWSFMITPCCPLL